MRKSVYLGLLLLPFAALLGIGTPRAGALEDELIVASSTGGILASCGILAVAFALPKRTLLELGRRGGEVLALPRRSQAFTSATDGLSSELAGLGLSPREIQFTKELLAGMTMKEIAANHGLAGSTIRNTFHSIYRRLSLGGQAELAVFGARLIDARKGNEDREPQA